MEVRVFIQVNGSQSALKWLNEWYDTERYTDWDAVLNMVLYSIRNLKKIVDYYRLNTRNVTMSNNAYWRYRLIHSKVDCYRLTGPEEKFTNFISITPNQIRVIGAPDLIQLFRTPSPLGQCQVRCKRSFLVHTGVGLDNAVRLPDFDPSWFPPPCFRRLCLTSESRVMVSHLGPVKCDMRQVPVESSDLEFLPSPISDIRVPGSSVLPLVPISASVVTTPASASFVSTIVWHLPICEGTPFERNRSFGTVLITPVSVSVSRICNSSGVSSIPVPPSAGLSPLPVTLPGRMFAATFFSLDILSITSGQRSSRSTISFNCFCFSLSNRLNLALKYCGRSPFLMQVVSLFKHPLKRS